MKKRSVNVCKFHREASVAEFLFQKFYIKIVPF